MSKINKQNTKDILILVFLWYIVSLACSTIFQGAVDLLGHFGILMELAVNIATFCFIVGVPMWTTLNHGASGGSPVERVCKEILSEEKKKEELKKYLIETTPEIAEVREKLSQDIKVCLDGSGFTWQWATAGTVNRLYLYTYEMMQKGIPFYVATFELDAAGRILAISATVDDNQVTFVNEPYRQFKEMESEKRNRPVKEFMDVVMPSATWTWESIERHLILVNDIAAGYVNVVAQVAYAQDGTVAFLAMQDVAGTIIKNEDRIGVPAGHGPNNTTVATTCAQSDPVSTLDTTVAEIEIVPEKEEDETPVAIEAVAGGEGLQPSVQAGKETLPPTEEKSGPTEVQPKRDVDRKVEIISDPATELTSEEVKVLNQYIADGGLRPTDDPGLSEEDMLRASQNTYEFLATDINSYAVSAMEDGEDNFTFRWPEGIQTLKEAYFFAKYVVEQVEGFERATVRHSNMTITIFLSPEEL